MLIRYIAILYLIIQIQVSFTIGWKFSSEQEKLIPRNFDFNERSNEYENYDNCKRKCIHGARPMTCRYHFEIEEYHSLSKACFDCPYNVTDCFRKDCVPGDGTKRGVVVVNRQVPGPTIEVCRGDKVIVDVENKMSNQATTVHWHGQHQVATPYMDGAPFVTQCPILPQNKFRYTFTAAQGGTHFYHSHVGMQRADGLYGPIVVRVPDELNPHRKLYDCDIAEHVITIIDWTTQLGTEAFLAHHHNDGSNKPPTILINGLGRFREFDNGGTEPVFMPPARFKVKQGYRYRFRLINAGFLNCPSEITIDNHILEVISSDGSDIRVIPAISLVIYAGERFDFVLNADQPKGLYWIRVKGGLDCGKNAKKAFQVAILEYDIDLDEKTLLETYPLGKVTFENAHTDGFQINPVNIGTENEMDPVIVMPNLKSLSPWDPSLQEIPDFQFYIAYDFYKINNAEFHRHPHYGFSDVNPLKRVLTPQFNHISMQMPSFPLLSQRDEIADYMFCNNDTIDHKKCLTEHCICPHVIKVPFGAVVELVVIDEGVAYEANHPIHLHGYSFRVVAMERLGTQTTVAEVKEREANNLINRNLFDPPLKDTVTVPDGGFSILRFHATNPGFWLFHCHLEFHAEIGMALVFQVGETYDMLPVPRNFPKCGHYLPDEEENSMWKWS